MAEDDDDDWVPCHCGKEGVRIYFGPSDIRFSEGIHSLSRCIPRRPAGQTCACGVLTSTTTSGWNDGQVLPWAAQHHLFFGRKPIEDSFPYYLAKKKPPFRGLGPIYTKIHDVDGCERLSQWLKGV